MIIDRDEGETAPLLCISYEYSYEWIQFNPTDLSTHCDYFCKWQSVYVRFPAD